MVSLTQKQISKLFDVQRPAIIKHLSNIFKRGKLNENVVRCILEHTIKHGAMQDKRQANVTTMGHIKEKI
ncbi:prophage maintenance system killer protein (DOC) [Francisella cf. novicida Fx1]|uniref:hypothetical protein n=1 Tax=Francisella tularensis TaxID=263 RepID=UPI00020BCEF4|nr:hypothetical protein [Francisella tularensis]AEE87408.1 prophage maintenance system killer protein (DOC) [Francisella cf. novicida Fx1]APA83077.1 prophage maintenance system killer protein (DOC) [Francisella tularensis subsp. novicida PA10-7858]